MFSLILAENSLIFLIGGNPEVSSIANIRHWNFHQVAHYEEDVLASPPTTLQCKKLKFDYSN